LNPTDFDPFGTEGEHPEAVDRAVDDDPATFWFTESYTAGPVLADSGKEGVGLIVETGEVVTARDIQIQTDHPGWTAEIYGFAGEPPDDLAGWGDPLSAAPFEAKEETNIPLNETEADHFLIWITELTENTEDGGYFATIGEVNLFD
jgi:hypothetical protein